MTWKNNWDRLQILLAPLRLAWAARKATRHANLEATHEEATA